MKKPKVLPGTEKSVRAREMAVELMTQHKLFGWEFAFNDNVRRAGVCFYPTKARPGRIELSVHYVELNDEAEVRDTILHEIAHALVGRGHGHDAVWKAKCREIGAKPERCYDSSKVAMPSGKWRASCPGCAKLFSRHRKPKRTAGWHCRPCGPKNGSFVWAQVDSATSPA